MKTKVANIITSLGCSRMAVKSDQEPAISREFVSRRFQRVVWLPCRDATFNCVRVSSQRSHRERDSARARTGQSHLVGFGDEHQGLTQPITNGMAVADRVCCPNSLVLEKIRGRQPHGNLESEWKIHHGFDAQILRTNQVQDTEGRQRSQVENMECGVGFIEASDERWMGTRVESRQGLQLHHPIDRGLREKRSLK